MCEWGGTTVVAHGDQIDVLTFPALVVDERAGVAIFRGNDPAELLLLTAFTKRAGSVPRSWRPWSQLSATAVRPRCASRRPTTTRRPVLLSAPRLRLVELRPGAVNAARRHKPSIPELGDHGIPLTDELDLILELGPEPSVRCL